jgi:hypothetical protein
MYPPGGVILAYPGLPNAPEPPRILALFHLPRKASAQA